jgi:hypothetical protein
MEIYKLLGVMYMPVKVWNAGNWYQFLQPCFIAQLMIVVGENLETLAMEKREVV